jgi:hypothetical protein
MDILYRILSSLIQNLGLKGTLIVHGVITFVSLGLSSMALIPCEKTSQRTNLVEDANDAERGIGNIKSETFTLKVFELIVFSYSLIFVNGILQKQQTCQIPDNRVRSSQRISGKTRGSLFCARTKSLVGWPASS